jgi:hypothetical protein
MIRLIGILTGSALAVTVMLVAFGVPELIRSADAPVTTSPIEVTSPDVGPVVLEEITVEAPGQPVKPVEAIDEVDLAAIPPATDLNMRIGPEAPAEKPGEPFIASAPEPAAASQPQNWYAFWSPFRSELAANGFISELQRTTGLDYRVVKLKPGVYEVAFAYIDPTDRQDKLEQISAATGLDMSGG